MNLLQEIFATLKHNKLRTTLTGLSVSWGIFILIVLLGAGNGLKNGVVENFSERSTNTVQMWAGRTSLPYKGLKTNRSLKFTEKELQTLQDKVSESENQTGIINHYSVITYKNEYNSYDIKGVQASYGNMYNLKFTPGNGRFINQSDINHLNKVIVLDQKIADALFKGNSPIGEFVKVGSIMYKVIGVNTKKEGWNGSQAYIPFTTAQSIYNPNKKFNSISFTTKGLETKEDNDKFDDQLKEKMSHTMMFDPKDEEALWINNSKSNYLQTMEIFNGLNIFIMIVGIFTLIAGIVGVSNIMLVSVKERTREIGIRKAIGAPPASILRSIVIESIIITAIFGYLGMITGIGITEIVNFIMEQGAATSQASSSGQPKPTIFLNPTVPLGYVIVSTLILIISGVIAGYMPAKRATRIKPIEAMREE